MDKATTDMYEVKSVRLEHIQISEHIFGIMK